MTIISKEFKQRKMTVSKEQKKKRKGGKDEVQAKRIKKEMIIETKSMIKDGIRKASK